MALETRSRTRVRNLKLALLVVATPHCWVPLSRRDVPPVYFLVDRAGHFEKELARDLQAEFNDAEILARRAGRPQHLWMIVPPLAAGGGRHLFTVLNAAKGGAA